MLLLDKGFDDDNGLRAHIVHFFLQHDKERLLGGLKVGRLVQKCRKRGLMELNERLFVKYGDRIDPYQSLGEPNDVILAYCRAFTPVIFLVICNKIKAIARAKDAGLEADVRAFFSKHDPQRICKALFLWTDTMGRARSKDVLRNLYSHRLHHTASTSPVPSFSPSPANSPFKPLLTPAQRRRDRYKNLGGDGDGGLELFSKSCTETPKSTLRAGGRNFSPNEIKEYEDDTFEREKEGKPRFFLTKQSSLPPGAPKANTQLSHSDSLGTSERSRLKHVRSRANENVKKVFTSVAKVLRRNDNFDISGLRRLDREETELPEAVAPAGSGNSANFARPPVLSSNIIGLSFEQRKNMALGLDDLSPAPEPKESFSLPIRKLKPPAKVAKRNREVPKKRSKMCNQFSLCEDMSDEFYGNCEHCGMPRNFHAGESVEDEELVTRIACNKYEGKGATCGGCGFPLTAHQWYAFDVPPKLLEAQKKAAEAKVQDMI